MYGLEDVHVEVNGQFCGTVKFHHLETKFDDRDRLLTLFSEVTYSSEDFNWNAVLPTVKIPYKDPALGFLLDEKIFSSVGVYARAPGVIPDDDTSKTERSLVVVNSSNTVYLRVKRNAVQIVFPRNNAEPHLPIGIFLKAVAGLPYASILERFKYKPQILRNSFPCTIPSGNEDMASFPIYENEDDPEPTVAECIDAVYSALMQIKDDPKYNYSTHWKHSRVKDYLGRMDFKGIQKYESTLALGYRAVGNYLDQDLDFPYFVSEEVVSSRLQPDGSRIEQKKVKETIQHFKLEKGHYLTPEDGKAIRRFDIDSLRIRANDSKCYILEEHNPMLFRIKGYKLLEDIKELDVKAGTIIDDKLLKEINRTEIKYLEVMTPNGRKVVHRSQGVEVSDFYTIINLLLVPGEDVTQYEIRNRLFLDYESQVQREVESVYTDILDAICGTTTLNSLAESLPPLPSNKLVAYLKDSRHKEISSSDMTNIMSCAIANTKASALMQETPAPMMQVQLGQYGRLDALHSPDSDKVGSVQHLTVTAKLENGEILAPYEKVKDGLPTGKILYLTAGQEVNKYIATWDCDFSLPEVMARYNGSVVPVAPDKVAYKDVSPYCDMSISRACNPLGEFSQPKRAIMAAKMSGQAIPIVHPERARVSTGADTIIPSLYYSGRDLLKSYSIPIDENVRELFLADYKWGKVFLQVRLVYNGVTFEVSLPFTASDWGLYNFRVNIKSGNIYDLDDIIFYNQSCDIKKYDFWPRMKQGALPVVKDYTRPATALGVNLRVCFKTYGSCTIDDALVISDRLISDNTVSSIQIIKYSHTLEGSDSLVKTECAELYSHVNTDEPVITYQDAKARTRVIRAKQAGVVVHFEFIDGKTRSIETWVATLHHAEVGDKMAGRHGNKSVIAKIVPEYMMPYDPDDGIPMDVVVSPLGIPSRMNFGQILEAALGLKMVQDDKVAVISPFYHGIKEEIIEEYKSAGFKPKRLFNPVYGKLTEREVFVGVLYYMKLEQMSNLKYSATGYPEAVDAIFGQPVRTANQGKGQSMEEMITWALIAAGAHKTLDSLFTIYSGDEVGRKAYFQMLNGNYCDVVAGTVTEKWDESDKDIPRSKESINSLVTQTIFRCFGLDIKVENNAYHVLPLDMDDISFEISRTSFINGREVVKSNEWFKVPLVSPVVNPFWVYNFPLHLVLGIPSTRALVKGKAWLNPDALSIEMRDSCIYHASEVDDTIGMLTGIDAIIALLKHTTVDEAIDFIARRYGSNDPNALSAVSIIDSDEELGDEDTSEVWVESITDVPMYVGDILKVLGQFKKRGIELSDLVWTYLPIMPRVFRQDNIVNGTVSINTFTVQLKSLCNSRATSAQIFEGLREFIGYGSKPKSKESQISIRGFFFGKGASASKHGKVRSSVLSKRVGFSGRNVIAPMEDIEISPFFVGLPWREVMPEMAKILAIRVHNRMPKIYNDLHDEYGLDCRAILRKSLKQCEDVIASLAEFNKEIMCSFTGFEDDEALIVYYYLRSVVKKLVEGEVSPEGLVKIKGRGWCDPQNLGEHDTIDCCVAASGRQPTLHKKSVRSYFVKLVDGYCLRIHPLVCSAYNADFDGDQMWHAQMLGDCKVESLKTISVLQDLISEKDGSYTLTIQQDAVLGLYSATVNIGEIKKNGFHFFDDLEELKARLEQGYMHYSDIVIFYHGPVNRYYCSTAGRILINGHIPGAFTKIPFKDSFGILKGVLGEEYTSRFSELKYDTIFVSTGDRPIGRPDAIKVNDILIDVYNTWGARQSVVTAQSLYEIGLVASDIVSVSICLDDMQCPIDKQPYLDKARETSSIQNTLYECGLITDSTRKIACRTAWENAKDSAKVELLKALPSESNTFYMMYSGARGKAEQLMQALLYIGTISKTSSEDIEYPILRGYAEGLSSLDLHQASWSGRLGIISTQAGTKDTGYSTRQSTYMMSGFMVKSDDCGIEWSSVPVLYSDDVKVIDDKGVEHDMSYLLGNFVEDSTERYNELLHHLNLSGFIINETVVRAILKLNITRLVLSTGTVEIKKTIDPRWRKEAIRDAYSYSLPFTDNMKLTDKTIDFIEKHGLTKVIAFDEETFKSGSYFDLEPYMPVLYTDSFTLFKDGVEISTEDVYPLCVAEDSPDVKYYKNFLSNGNITEKGLQCLTQKRVRIIKFTNGEVVHVKYKLSELFKSLVFGRLSVGLLYLDEEGTVTNETIDYIEDYQLEYIPIRTSLTCLQEEGICSKCYGKSPSSKKFLPIGYNLGISAAQSMCEPLSQSTLNVGHSGGKRDAGLGQLSGLTYYMKLIRADTPGKNKTKMEKYASISGFVERVSGDIIKIVGDNGDTESFIVDTPSRLNVSPGAYVDAGDVVVLGATDINRYSGSDVFDSAIKTRLHLLEQYYQIFKSLNVSSRNPEILARAQTSICYYDSTLNTNRVRIFQTKLDTATEAKNPTGCYRLVVSQQAAVAQKFSGIACYGFENVANMLLQNVFMTEGIKLNSCLGNLITGTKVGSTEAVAFPNSTQRQRKSAIKEHEKALESNLSDSTFSISLTGAGDYSIDTESKLMDTLLSAESQLAGGELLALAEESEVFTEETTSILEEAAPETPLFEEEIITPEDVEDAFNSVETHSTDIGKMDLS